MGPRRGFRCLVWGSLASLAYPGPTNLERDVNAAPTHMDATGARTPARATLAGTSTLVALAGPTMKVERAEPTTPVAAVDPSTKLALVTPNASVSAPEPVDECVVWDGCTDQYLWSAYERARKVDTVKVRESFKVTVKKKGKKRTVTKTRIKFVNEDFTWKDPDAAQKAGMPLPEYVIGGMDHSFRVKLYCLLRALDDAGLAPGITSGFRDNYRQSIANGNKAASDSSYHGGSRRGGYGHGLAADVVSVKGETRAERLISSDILWKWIDEHGEKFGIGRPYLDRDPPHIGPIDGKEYVDKRGVSAKRSGS